LDSKNRDLGRGTVDFYIFIASTVVCISKNHKKLIRQEGRNLSTVARKMESWSRAEPGDFENEPPKTSHFLSIK
jgi:hypothetical protein